MDGENKAITTKKKKKKKKKKNIGSCVDPNPLRVERQDPDNFPRLQTRERCALEIAAYVFKSDVCTVKNVKALQYFFTGRSKVVHLPWIFLAICFSCLYLLFCLVCSM